MISFLYFDGFKIKDGRSPGVAGILFDAPTATFHQDNAYTDNPLHGLWKIADDRVVSANMFVSAKYAYFNTGIHPRLRSAAWTCRRAATSRPAQSYGSISQGLNVRPQQTVNVDAHSFVRASGMSHDLKYGSAIARTDRRCGTQWPGNGILGDRELADRFPRAGVPPGQRRQPRQLLRLLSSATPSRKGRATIDVGVRFDRQWGSALASTIAGNRRSRTWCRA